MDELDKTVMLVTSGSGNYELDIAGVDTVSSASTKEDVGNLVKTIFGKLDTILQQAQD